MSNVNDCMQQPCTNFDFNAIWNTAACHLNPVEELGIAHNKVLSHLEGTEVISDLEGSYNRSASFLAGRYDQKIEDFLPWRTIYVPFLSIVEDGYAYYAAQQRRADLVEGEVMEKLEQILLTSSSRSKFDKRIDKLVLQTMAARDLDREQRAKMLGTLAVAKHSVIYWDARVEGDFFEETETQRKKGPFWADIGGFVGGFVGGLIYNNNNGGGTDVNPFATGVAVGGLASKAAKELKG